MALGAQPCLGVGLAIELLDTDRLEGRGPLDGSQPIGEGGEAVEVVAGFVVATRSLRRVVAPAAVVLVVGVRDVVFLVVLATSLLLGGVALAVMVVDARAQVLLVELEAEVILVDLLFIIAMGSC